MLAALMKSPTDYDPVEQPDALGRAHRAGAGRHGRDRRDHRRPQRGQGAGPDAQGLEDAPPTRAGAVFRRLGRRPDPPAWSAAASRTWWSRPRSTLPTETAAGDAAKRDRRALRPRTASSQAALVSLDGAGPGARHGRRRRLRRQPLQPRRRRPPPGRLVVEAVRLSGRAWRPAARPTRLVVDQPVTIDGWSPQRLRGRASWARSPCRQALAQSINTVAAQPRRRGRPAERGRRRAPARHHHADQHRPGHGAGHQPGHAAGDGRRPTTPSPTAATASRPTASSASAPAGGQVICRSIRRRRRRRRSPIRRSASWTRCCARWSPSGTGVQAGDPRLRHRRQDRHHLGLQGRLVLRLHRRPDHGGLDGPRRQHADARHHRRHAPRRSFWHAFMVRAVHRLPVTAIPAGPAAPTPVAPTPVTSPEPGFPTPFGAPAPFGPPPIGPAPPPPLL